MPEQDRRRLGQVIVDFGQWLKGNPDPLPQDNSLTQWEKQAAENARLLKEQRERLLKSRYFQSAVALSQRFSLETVLGLTDFPQARTLFHERFAVHLLVYDTDTNPSPDSTKRYKENYVHFRTTDYTEEVRPLASEVESAASLIAYTLYRDAEAEPLRSELRTYINTGIEAYLSCLRNPHVQPVGLSFEDDRRFARPRQTILSLRDTHSHATHPLEGN